MRERVTCPKRSFIQNEGSVPGFGTPRNTALTPRQSFGKSQIIAITKAAKNARKASGCANANQIAPSTSASSVNDAAQLEKGSGDPLMIARPPALVKCVPAV